LQEAGWARVPAGPAARHPAAGKSRSRGIEALQSTAPRCSGSVPAWWGGLQACVSVIVQLKLMLTLICVTAAAKALQVRVSTLMMLIACTRVRGYLTHCAVQSDLHVSLSDLCMCACVIF